MDEDTDLDVATDSPTKRLGLGGRWASGLC